MDGISEIRRMGCAVLLALAVGAGGCKEGATSSGNSSGTSSQSANSGDVKECASRLRMLGQAITMYANKNGGKLPSDLAAVVAMSDFPPECCLCPASGTSYRTVMDMSPSARAEWARSKGDFVYLGKGRTVTFNHPQYAGAEFVLVHDKPLNHGVGGQSGGINVLYGDGHLEFLGPKEAEPVLRELAAGRNPPRLR